MKILSPAKILASLFFIFSFFNSFSQDKEDSLSLSLDSTGLLINNNHKTHIWWFTNKEYHLDISDISLKNKELFISIDSLNNNEFTGQWSEITKIGMEGDPNSFLKIKIIDNSPSDNFIPKLSLFSKVDPSLKFDLWFGPESIKYKNGQSHFYKIFNDNYYQFQQIGEGLNLLSKGIRIQDPTRLKEIGLFYDLNSDGIKDLIFGNDQIYFNGNIEQIGRGLMVPVYVQVNPSTYTNHPWNLNVSYEDVSSPNSSPASLIHNLDDYTFMDLNGDSKNEIIGWGEHYHVGSKPNWQAIASQLGLERYVDYNGTNGQPTIYDSVFYSKRFYYYQIEDEKWRSKEKNIPAYTALTGVFQGAVGDADGDGDNDIVHKSFNGQLMTLINDGTGVFSSSTFSGELVKTFLNETQYRSVQYFIDKLIDMDQDGKLDILMNFKSIQFGLPNRLVYFKNSGNNQFDLSNPIDAISYSNDFNSENWMSYDIIQADLTDLNKDGKNEIVLVVSRDYSGDANESIYKTQTIFKILEVNKDGLIDLTSNYFKNNSNILPIMLSNEGATFSIQDINGDGNLDIIPRFILRDPAKFNWVNPKNWSGTWNNTGDFQYFQQTNNGFEIVSLGKFFDNSSNDYLYNYFEFNDLDNNSDPEIIALFSGQTMLGKKVDHFSQNPIFWDINDESKMDDFKIIPISNLDPNSIVISFLKNQTTFSVEGNKIILKNIEKPKVDSTYILPYKIEDTQLNRYSYGQIKVTIKAKKEVILGAFKEYQPIKISPNPVKNHFSIQFDESFGKEVKVELVDISGKILQTKTHYRANNLIDIQHLNAGLYLIRISSSENNKIETIKLIKD